MGTHPIFESDFDCLTEMVKRVAAHIRGMKFPKRQPWTPKIPESGPVIPESILKIADAAGPRRPLIAKRMEPWIQVGEPDKIEVVRVGIELMKRRPISDAEADAI